MRLISDRVLVLEISNYLERSELGNKKIGKDDLDKFLALGYTKGRKVIVV